jgi:hypothetical protein
MFQLKLILRMASHESMLKDIVLYPVPGTTEENHNDISDRIAGQNL